MGLETATYIHQLNASNPTSSDVRSEGDDHLRMLKSTLQATFPNISGAVTPTHTELNYVDGVTSSIQTQLDARATTSLVFGSTYTPTGTAITNCSLVTTNANTQYARLNNIVIVGFSVVVQFSGAGVTQFDITLPVASNLSTIQQISGTAINNATRDPGLVSGNTTDDRARITLEHSDTAGSYTVTGTFTYVVV